MAEQARGRPPSRRESERYPGRGVSGLPIFSAFQYSRAAQFHLSIPCPAGGGPENCAEQSQLAVRGIDDNTWRQKELRGQGVDYGGAKTKPILPGRELAATVGRARG
jgi:hypothetical protein